jgi:hypothetical protein
MANKIVSIAWKGLLVIVILFALYTWLTLSWSYARGERAGYVQKLSQKGWVCKTWEGELAMVNAPGTLTEKFLFTVRDDSVAKKINDVLGKRVALSYEQHVGVPSSCFGDTSYFVTDVREVGENAPAPVPAPPAPATK